MHVKGSRPLLFLPPALHLVLMVLFSLLPPGGHTYFSLAVIAVLITVPLTAALVADITQYTPSLCPLLPLSFGVISPLLHWAMGLIGKLRPYDALPYEWSKYPRLISQYYSTPFFLFSCLIALCILIHQKRKKAAPMNQPSRSVRFTIFLNRAMMALVVLLIFTFPTLLRWYNTVRILIEGENYALIAAFYSCVPVVLYALWNLDRLLGNIARGEVFVMDNVRLIRRDCVCCAVVGLICLPASFLYAPLIFMTVIMGFLCPVVNVVCQVIRAAIELREENDLTI